MGTTPKKILYVSSMGGHDRRFLEKLKTLGPEWEPHFATFKPALLEEYRAIGLPMHDLNPEQLPFDDWDRAGAYPFWQRWKLRHLFRKHRLAFAQLIDRLRPDVIHAGWIQTDSYVAALEKRSPLIAMEWGSDILLRPFDNRRNLRKTRLVLSKADLISCDCEIAAQKTREILAPGSPVRPILQFPWGIDLKRFNAQGRSPLTLNPLRIIVIKNLVEVSRLETLIEAAAILLKNKKIDFRIEVLGDGERRDQLMNLTAKNNLTNHIKFHGRIANHEIPARLRQADIYLSCNRSEGTSLAMMEAMACGVVPIVTDLPAYREWIRSPAHGWLFPVDDAMRLTEILGQCLNQNRPHLEKIQNHNLALAAENFDWEKNFAKLVAGYQQLVTPDKAR